MESNGIGSWLKFVLQQIAAESYLDRFISGQASLVDVLQLGNNRLGFGENNYSRMTLGQAITFDNQYDIIDHHQNDATGFSATVIKDRDTGAYTLSFRSTESRNSTEGGDWLRDGASGADGEIFAQGFALGQLAAMEAYYQELKSSGKLPSGATLNVTGFSLGGHLATVFTELHHADLDITFGQTYTFNAAGRGHIAGSETSEGDRIRGMLTLFEAILRDPDAALPYTTADDLAYLAASGRGDGWNPFQPGSLENAYLDPRYVLAKQIVLNQYGTAGVNPLTLPAPGEVGTDSAFQKITQLYGQADHGDQELVANSGVHGPATSVFIEDQPDLAGFGGFFGTNGEFGTTHSLILMVDSLALMDLFQTVDNTVTQTTIEQIFSASSNQRGFGFIASSGIAEGNSLENALDALRKVFLGNVEPTRFGRQTGDFGQPEYRNEFYANLEQVKEQVFPDGAQIGSLVGMLPQDMSNQAEEEIAYRYALRELNPFVVFGADYSQHNINGQLDRFNSIDGTGTLTHEYLIDRALFLAKKIELNLSDSEAGVTGIHYQDVTTGYEIAPTLAGTEVIFGGDSSEGVSGKGDDDRLYGGDGHDVLKGLAGDDYLEGNQGSDILNGGSNDDLLKGGAGFDTYIYSTGDGIDRIEDTQEQNAILMDGQLLQGGSAEQVMTPIPTRASMASSPMSNPVEISLSAVAMVLLH